VFEVFPPRRAIFNLTPFVLLMASMGRPDRPARS